MLGEQFDIQTLRALPLFSPLSDEKLERLRPALTVESRNVGDVLIQEGDIGETMYVLLLGEVKVVSNHRESTERVVATISPLSHLGICPWCPESLVQHRFVRPRRFSPWIAKV